MPSYRSSYYLIPDEWDLAWGIVIAQTLVDRGHGGTDYYKESTLRATSTFLNNWTSK